MQHDCEDNGKIAHFYNENTTNTYIFSLFCSSSIQHVTFTCISVSPTTRSSAERQIEIFFNRNSDKTNSKKRQNINNFRFCYSIELHLQWIIMCTGRIFILFSELKIKRCTKCGKMFKWKVQLVTRKLFQNEYKKNSTVFLVYSLDIVTLMVWFPALNRWLQPTNNWTD